jgi:hypothetical protein
MKSRLSFFTLSAALFGAVLLGSCKEKPANSGISSEASQVAEGKLSTKIVENPTEITFERDLHDFGDIIQGEKVTTEFKFTNTGKADLIITNASGSCGCTVPEWPKEPIAPGEGGVIKVAFNSDNRSAAFNKTVTVTANTIPTSNTKLIIKGNIIVPKDK